MTSEMSNVCRSNGQSVCETRDTAETRDLYALHLEEAAKVIRAAGQDFDARVERRLFFRRHWGGAEIIGRRLRITIEIREGHQRDV